MQSLKASTGQGVNALFPNPSPTPQPIGVNTKKMEDDTRQAVRTHERSNERSSPSTSNPLYSLPTVPKKRQPERYAFQFWADQITRLRKLHKLLNLLEDTDARSGITLSDLVREAIDDYLHKQTKAFQKRVSGRRKVVARSGGRTSDRTYARSDERPYDSATREAEAT